MLSNTQKPICPLHQKLIDETEYGHYGWIDTDMKTAQEQFGRINGIAMDPEQAVVLCFDLEMDPILIWREYDSDDHAFNIAPLLGCSYIEIGDPHLKMLSALPMPALEPDEEW